MQILQKLFYNKENRRYEFETLYVSPKGEVRCDTCVNQLYNKSRNTKSDCIHARQLREDIKNNNMSSYKDVSPK